MEYRMQERRRPLTTNQAIRALDGFGRSRRLRSLALRGAGAPGPELHVGGHHLILGGPALCFTVSVLPLQARPGKRHALRRWQPHRSRELWHLGWLTGLESGRPLLPRSTFEPSTLGIHAGRHKSWLSLSTAEGTRLWALDPGTASGIAETPQPAGTDPATREGEMARASRYYALDSARQARLERLLSAPVEGAEGRDPAGWALEVASRVVGREPGLTPDSGEIADSADLGRALARLEAETPTHPDRPRPAPEETAPPRRPEPTGPGPRG